MKIAYRLFVCPILLVINTITYADLLKSISSQVIAQFYNPIKND